MKKITFCASTTTRADYGILRPLLQKLRQSDWAEPRLAVSGTHLSAAFGNTVEEIEADAMPIDARIPILEQDTPVLEQNTPESLGGAPAQRDTPEETARIMGRTIERFAAYFARRRPDALIALGDRFEMFAICAAALCARIPIAHLYGGETTEGAIDEAFRHSITKMASLHFTATEAYRRRVIQLGEDPARVFRVGALGVENALHSDFLTLEALETDLAFPLRDRPYALVTFHPVTLEDGTASAQLEELLAVLAERRDMRFLITKSNADPGGGMINARLDRFGETHAHCDVTASLGMRRYLSAVKYAACVIGNSSSGLVEVPSFGVPTVNIGDRQKGRIRAESVLDCPPAAPEIRAALDRALSPDFRRLCGQVRNPYGDGNTSGKICRILRERFSGGAPNLKKTFYDLPMTESLFPSAQSL